MTAPGNVSAWKARSSLLPLEQKESGMGTGICEHGWLPFARGDHFLHHEPWFLIPLCFAPQHHGVACSLLFWCVRVSPACPQGTGVAV